MNLESLKALDIWEDFVKIKDFIEPSYRFRLKNSDYRFYCVDLGDHFDRWWCNSERRDIDFAEVYETVPEKIREELLFHVDLLT